MNDIKFIQVKNAKELDLLRGRKAQYKDLCFSFSSKYIKKLADNLKSKNAIQIVAKIGDKFAGYIASAEILEQYPNYLVIFELFVEPNMQGMGIGTQLVQNTIRQAKDQDIEGLIVQTEKENIPAQRLYEKLGFVKINNPNWKDGITYKWKYE